MDWSIIGQKIKQQRKKEKMTQLELANLIGKTESSIRKYEKGLVNIPTEVLELIAEKLDVTPFVLIGPEWWDIQMGLEKAEKLHRAANAELGISAMLEKVFGAIEEKWLMGKTGGQQSYWVVGKAPNTFVLYDRDIDTLVKATEAMLPSLVERMKDTRPESEIIQEILAELNQMEAPKEITPLQAHRGTIERG